MPLADTPDPIVTVRVTSPGDPPGMVVYGICRRSTARKLAADAEDGAQVADLGAALLLCQVYERKRAALGAGLIRVGTGSTG